MPQGYIDVPLHPSQQQKTAPASEDVPLDAPAATPPLSGGIGGFLSEATAGVNPVKINEAIQQAFWHPVATVQGISAAHEKVRGEAMQAFQQGDYLTGSRKLVDWLIPVIGPAIDRSADLMASGQIARGTGAAVDIGTSLAGPSAVGRAVAKIPGVVPALNRAVESRVVRTIAPQLGPEKLRFGSMAADVAPAIARETTARTVPGLLEEVSGKAAQANARLDAAYTAVPTGRPLWTHPVAQGIERKIANLSVPGAFGETIEPATRAARIASLKQALKEVNGLQQTASLEDLRNLRQAWDEGAQAVFTPITADNFAAARGAGHGWADARDVLQEHVVNRHPELKSLNTDVNLWLKAQEVMQAAEDVERVRTRVGRSIMARGVGAMAGGAVGGSWGAGFAGAVLGPSIEAAMAATSGTVKLSVARGLAQLADALQAGSTKGTTAALQAVTAAVPGAKRAALLAQAVRLIRDLQPAPLPVAVPAGGSPPAKIVQ